MPTYQYRCTDCGEQLEVVQKFSDDPLTDCPHCQGRLRKVFSSVGVVFKGSGFYKTDSRSSAKTSSSSSPAPSTPSSSSPASSTGGDSSGTSSSTSSGTSTPAPSAGDGKVA